MPRSKKLFIQLALQLLFIGTLAFSFVTPTYTSLSQLIHNQTSLGIYEVRWSPEGTRLAAAHADGTVKIYDEQGNLEAALAGHTEGVRAIGWSPDGRLLASGARHDPFILIWNSETGDLVYRLDAPEFSEGVYTVGWSPDGTQLAAAGFDMFQIWETSTWNSTYRSLATLFDFAWSPDSQTLAGATLYLFGIVDPATNTFSDFSLTEQQASSSVNASTVSWSRSGHYIATTDRLASAVSLWDAQAHTLMLRYPILNGRAVDVTFISDTSLAVVTNTGRILRVDIPTGEVTTVLIGAEELRVVDWTPLAGGLLAVGGIPSSYVVLPDGQIRENEGQLHILTQDQLEQ